LAESAIVGYIQPIKRVDILNAIGDARRKAGSFSEYESETMPRLK
jgi:hypothetical protein